MSNECEIVVPDIGGSTDVEVIEILVNTGDSIKKEDALITLESDKASMEIPASEEGVVKEICLKVGDKVSQGDAILIVIQTNNKNEKSVSKKTPLKDTSKLKEETTIEKTEEKAVKNKIQQVVVPDIGGASDVDIIEVLVKAGDKVVTDTSLIVLESDKATMEIPSPFSGIINDVSIKVGDKVSAGDLVLTMQVEETLKQTPQKKQPDIATSPKKEVEKKVAPTTEIKAQTKQSIDSDTAFYASPSIRRFARELGVDLSSVTGSGRKARIVKEDVQAFVKTRLHGRGDKTPGFQMPSLPAIDFSVFGEIEKKPLNKIKRLTADNMHRAWLTVPHVTQFDESDITGLEAFRKSQKSLAEKEGYKLTALAFIVKAVVKGLQAYPQFNASLDNSGEQLIYKKYFNIGIAVDTPNGLVVPVIKETNVKGIADIAKDMASLSEKARNKKLMPQDMQGGCFTISSLGGIGGTAFTPIVNAPEVAILGVSRASMKPFYQDGAFVPRLMLPLSLSYDHRVIDGAEAAHFTRFVCDCLADIRTLLL